MILRGLTSVTFRKLASQKVVQLTKDAGLEGIDHPCVKTFWQPIHAVDPVINSAGIDKILPWIAGGHVFHWWPNHEVRLPLSNGANNWKMYFTHLSGIQENIYGNLEFIKDDSIDQFFNDAGTLMELSGYRQGSIKNVIPNDN